MQKLTPFLWMHGQAEEACRLYTSLFSDSSYEVSMPGPDGSAFILSLNVQGQTVVLMNNSPEYTLTPAFSFQVSCVDQAEVDRIWDGLMEGGSPMACGWITDRFGLTWQVIPNRFLELLNEGTPAQIGAVMGAMQQMVKFEIAPLEAAFEAAAE